MYKNKLNMNENIRKHNPIQNETLDNKLSLNIATGGIEVSSIPGYNMPTTYGYKGNDKSRGSGYKSFNADAKKVNEFSINSTYMNQSQVQSVYDFQEYCPVCNEVAKFNCPCGYSDKTCANGHVWYTERESGKIKLNNPHL